MKQFEKPLDTWVPSRSDLSSALSEFVPVVRKMKLQEAEFEDAIPISLPNIGGLQMLACVYAPTHQDLSHPRYSVLAPIVVGNNVTLTVEKDGVKHQQTLRANELIVLDSHQPHGLSKPSVWPEQSVLDQMSLTEKTELKRQNMSVFFSMDYVNKPTREQVEKDFARILHLPASQPTKKSKQNFR